MKKLVLVVMVMCGLVIGLTACGGKSDPIAEQIAKDAEAKRAAEAVNHWDYPVLDNFELDLTREDKDVYICNVNAKGKPDADGEICYSYTVKECSKENYDKLLEKGKKPDQTMTERQPVELKLKDPKAPIKIDYSAITYYPEGGYMLIDVFYNAEGIYGVMHGDINDLEIEEREKESENALIKMAQDVLNNTAIIKD